MANLDVQRRPPPTKPGNRASWRLIVAVAVIVAAFLWVTCAAIGFPM